MRSLLPVASALMSLAPLTLAVPAERGEPSPARQNELVYRLRHDCGSCHGMTLKGGLGPSLRPEALRGREDEALADIILHGLPGTPMPPWSVEITADEAIWLVRRLKEGLPDDR